MDRAETGHHVSRGMARILPPERPLADAIGDDFADQRRQPDERLFRHPVVQDPVLRPMDDLDQVALDGSPAGAGKARPRSRQGAPRASGRAL